MQNFVRERPFDNFRVAITDPSHFFGRSELINTMLKSPFQVRILLGGRRLGKTSALRAVEWNLLNPNTNYPRRAFPVLINLQLEQPKDLDNLRYLLIARFREAIERWRDVPLTEFRQMYREFLSQIKSGEVTLSFLKQLNIKLNINNPDSERRLNNDSFRLAFLKTTEELRKLNFQGVCFLIDGAEFIVRQNWATDAWSYLRGLKDTDTAIKPCLGLLLSGYRDLKEYQQRVGSPLLNIAEIEWLAPLRDNETKELIRDRAEQEKISLSEEKITSLIEWSGCHPYLTQQALNIIFDSNHQQQICANLIDKLLQHHDKDFSAWWNAEHLSGCFGEDERKVYYALVQHHKGTPQDLAQYTGFSRVKVADALEVIAGTGVIRQLDDESYTLGSRLFEEWVTQQDVVNLKT
ncbi:ATP-binding protein [Nostoc sp.]|uniref:ATP-binding protein n=1 Tax=Nostoc sp. TaxID=1180 RepID=UPI002FF5C47E